MEFKNLCYIKYNLNIGNIYIYIQDIHIGGVLVPFRPRTVLFYPLEPILKNVHLQ